MIKHTAYTALTTVFPSLAKAVERAEGYTGRELVSVGVLTGSSDQGITSHNLFMNYDRNRVEKVSTYTVVVEHPLLDESIYEEYVLEMGVPVGEDGRNEDDIEVGPGSETDYEAVDPLPGQALGSEGPGDDPTAHRESA